MKRLVIAVIAVAFAVPAFAGQNPDLAIFLRTLESLKKELTGKTVMVLDGNGPVPAVRYFKDGPPKLVPKTSAASGDVTADHLGVTGGTVDLSYNTEYFTATANPQWSWAATHAGFKQWLQIRGR